MKMIQFFLIASIVFIFTACSSSKTSSDSAKQTDSSEPKNRILPVGEPIPVGSCSVVGTILSIETDRRSPDVSSPCSKAPCWATVRIDSILGYGSGFDKPLAVGGQVSVMFGFTLEPTKDLFPNMSESYPGLQVGSRFFANVRASSGMGSDKASYTVFGYKVR